MQSPPVTTFRSNQCIGPSSRPPLRVSPWRSPHRCRCRRRSPISRSVRSFHSCRRPVPARWPDLRSPCLGAMAARFAVVETWLWRIRIPADSRRRTPSVPGVQTPTSCSPLGGAHTVATVGRSRRSSSRALVCQAATVSGPTSRIGTGATAPVRPFRLAAFSTCSPSRDGECRSTCCRRHSLRPRRRPSCVSGCHSTWERAATRIAERLCGRAIVEPKSRRSGSGGLSRGSRVNW